MADRLVCWLYGTPVAELARAAEYRIALEWRAEALGRWGGGSRVLSVGLPLGLAIGPRDDRGLDFFENVLPEGAALTRMAALARLGGLAVLAVKRYDRGDSPAGPARIHQEDGC
jgi:hypothetical protein